MFAAITVVDNTYKMTGSPEAATQVKDKMSDIVERMVRYDNGRVIYVRRASTKDAIRAVAKENLNFNNSHLSKQHACFQYRDGTLYVKDCGSTFGTTVNDKFVVSGKWYPVSQSDTIGFIVSIPSNSIAKIVSRFPDQDEIPLKEFSNPLVALKLRFYYECGKLVFTVVDDDESSVSRTASTNVVANETYDTDAYCFGDCIHKEETHSLECLSEEKSSTEEKEDEDEVECTLASTTDFDSNEQKEECVSQMEDYLLDCKGSVEDLQDLDVIKEPSLEIAVERELRKPKLEFPDDEEDSSFAKFSSELISEPEDSLSGFSNSSRSISSPSPSSSSSSSSSSDSSSDSSSSSVSSSSSNLNINSEASSLAGGYKSNPEVDTSVIENINDSDDEGCYICQKKWAHDTVFGTIDGLPTSCHSYNCGKCSISRKKEAGLKGSNLDAKPLERRGKRSLDNRVNETIGSNEDEEREFKRIKLAPTQEIAKEIAKGAFYILATITALGVYGSTLNNQE